MFGFSFEEIFPALGGFIDWCAATWVGVYIHTVTWAFKFIETVHIVAWVALLGATMLVNLRLLGLLRGWSVAQMARSVAIYIYSSLALVLATGTLLFLSDPWKYYRNIAFGPKMLFLAMVVLYQFTLYPRAVRAVAEAPLWARIAALGSLLMWFYIGAAGRAIAVV